MHRVLGASSKRMDIFKDNVCYASSKKVDIFKNSVCYGSADKFFFLLIMLFVYVYWASSFVFIPLNSTSSNRHLKSVSPCDLKTAFFFQKQTFLKKISNTVLFCCNSLGTIFKNKVK